ncbi:ML domain-containing protein [Streptomyces sp. NPDC101490]|uniref:ML domain-containing protein n=1 Tax=Streptomyces sp. NPDC101490 TaxID=3366143 RepID=UPI00380C578B
MPTDLIEDASDDTYLLDIKDITLTPAFPEPGKELRIDLTGRLKAEVDLTQVQVQVQVKLGLVTLLRESRLLPDLLATWGAKLSGDSKPPAGEWKQSWTFQMPKEIPKGDFRIYFTSYAEDDSDFADLKARVDFRKR